MSIKPVTNSPDNKLSLYAFGFSCIFILLTGYAFDQKWSRPGPHNTISYDVSGYYWYLPAVLIHGDVQKLSFSQQVYKADRPTPDVEQYFEHKPSGNRVMTYTAGMAILYLPAFAIGHLAAIALGYPASGFSLPYQFALHTYSILIALIGLWYYRRLMLYYFTDKVVALLLLLLVIGTNYLNYTALVGAMPHSYLFTLYTFLLLATRQFYITPTYKLATAIGCLCGMAILIRPSEMICILLPLLWGMEGIGINSIKQRITLLLHQYKKLLVAALCTVGFGLIQVAYWLYVTGKPFVYSYGDDKGFSWKHPHVWDYTFSYRSGWATYTPLVFIMLLAFIPFLKYGRNKVAVILFFLLSFYIVTAWDIWWYAGTGGRAMLQTYPVILFPLATLLQLLTQRRWLLWLLAPVLAALAYFNLWFTYNAHAANGLYDPGGMTKSWYWHTIYRYHVPQEYLKYKDTDELFTGTPRNMQLLHSQDYEQDTLAINRTEPPINGKVSAVLSNRTEYAGSQTFAYQNGKAKWLRAQAVFRNVTKEYTDWKMPQLIVKFSNKGTLVKEGFIRITRFIEEKQTRTLHKDIIIPTEPFDEVTVFLWNPASDETVLMDDLKVYSFDE